MEEKKSIFKRCSEDVSGYLFVLPYGLFYLLFLIFPIIQGFRVSLYKWDIFGNKVFLGIGNYANLLYDPKFWSSLWHTVYFILLTTPPLIILGLALAMVLNLPFRGRIIFRAIFFFPYLLCISVIAITWMWLYQPHFGLINVYLQKYGLPAPSWLGDARFAMPAIAITTIWWTVGFNIILFLAGLQEIPEELYEAAKIDGASFTQSFFHITIPLLRRTTLLILMLQIIASFKIFGQVYIMTEGGPYGATRVLVQYIYDTGFRYFRMGYASSMAYILFSIMLVCSLLQFRLLRKR